MVTQICQPRGTVQVATQVSDWIDEVIAAHQQEIAAEGGLCAIHDWRQVRRYDSAARALWFERIQSRPKGYLRKAVVIVADNPLLKMAIAGANLLAALSLRGEAKIELASNIHEIVRKYSLAPPK